MKFSMFWILTFLFNNLLLLRLVESACPFLLMGTPIEVPDPYIPEESKYNDALESLDIEAVFDDIYEVMLDSQECFPADIFNGEQSYAGLFIRLAWHCSGTFRSTDGKGGCSGGRQRYQPESAWEDNINLDKARALLAPVKHKYGDALSWGDLFVFAGTAAILQGGGPMTEVCAGRIDDIDGELSVPLDDDSTCNEDGEDCQPPKGSDTSELIYVNAEGYLGNPDPALSAPQIREVFSRMGMNDTETVALIGGGHTFGKCHGACPLGAGLGPDEDPLNPWPGLCGNNFPEDTYTSGIEGQWTSYPFRWDNEYFKLLSYHINDYELITGPGNKYQWYNKINGLLMLTTDVAFMYDNEYKNIVNQFAQNNGLFNHYFSHAWAKLTTSGGTMASNSFCVKGYEVAPRRMNNCPSQESIAYTKRSMRKCDSSNGREKNNKKCLEGEFKFSNNYECENCQEIFGNSCLECKNNIGCKICAYGYSREKDSCGVWYCKPTEY